MTADRLADDLAFAFELADLADEITRAHFQPGGFPFENKYDGTPVTAIDWAVEQAIRERVASRRPRDVVLGEEAGGGEHPPPPAPLPRKRSWADSFTCMTHDCSSSKSDNNPCHPEVPGHSPSRYIAHRRI